MRLEPKDQVVRSWLDVRFKVSIENKGKKPVVLVANGDGSECGWRTPIIGWSVLKKESADHPRVFVPNGFRDCGNINAPTAEEVLTIAPGGRAVLPHAWQAARNAAKPFEVEGDGDPAHQYRVVFYYSNNPRMIWKGVMLGKAPEVLKRIRSSTPCELRSNEALVTWQSKPPPRASPK